MKTPMKPRIIKGVLLVTCVLVIFFLMKSPEQIPQSSPITDLPLAYRTDLFNLHPQQNFSKTVAPDLCVVFVSCKRPHLLEQTVEAFVQYMHRNEPILSYEMLVWDNGSGRETMNKILSLPFDYILVARSNTGIAYAFDQLLFNHCRSEYILTLEEDWMLDADGLENMPLLSMAMHILDTDNEILEVWLRYDHHNYPHTDSTWLLTPLKNSLVGKVLDGQVQYHKQFARKDTISGSYTNGASLKSKEKLKKVGRYQPTESADYDGEIWFQKQVNEVPFASGHVCMTRSANLLLRNRCSQDEDGINQPPMFVHIGNQGRSPGHLDIRVIE